MIHAHTTSENKMEKQPLFLMITSRTLVKVYEDGSTERSETNNLSIRELVKALSSAHCGAEEVRDNWNGSESGFSGHR